MNTLEPEVMPSEAVAVRQQDSAEQLIALAIERNANVETIERLMAIRRELRAEAAKVAFDNALAAFQKECPAIRKTKQVLNKDGRTVRYAYAPLECIIEQVKGVLAKYQLSHKEDAIVEEAWVTGICKITHSLGHSDTSSFKVPVDKSAYMTAPQTFASALTFAKRYAFCAALGIMTADEDDDANASHDAPHSPATAPQKRPEASKAATIPPKASAAPKAAPAAFPTVQQRDKMIEQLNARPGQPDRDIVTEYFVKAGAILDTEQLEDLPLRFVPATAGQMRAIGSAIAAFGNGEQAGLAFPPHAEPEAPPAPITTKPARKPIEVPRDEEAWRTFPIPFGKDAGTPLGKLEKNKLFGWWANFEVKTEYNGKPISHDKIAKDQKFREMLDAAGTHYEFKSPDDDQDDPDNWPDPQEGDR